MWLGYAVYVDVAMVQQRDLPLLAAWVGSPQLAFVSLQIFVRGLSLHLRKIRSIPVAMKQGEVYGVQQLIAVDDLDWL